MSLRVLIVGALILVLSLSPVLCQDAEEGSNMSAESATTGVLIPNVPSLKWTDGMCTFMGSLNLCLNYMGEKTTYPYLMGVSGAAFATRFHRDWNESSADAAVTDDHPKAAMQAVGYAYSWSQTADPSVLMESIDRGVPVIGIDLMGAGDWGVVIGYQRMGESWLCRTYYDKSSAPTSIGKVPWSVLIFGSKGKTPSVTENVRSSIKLAVEFGKGEHKLDAKYAVGFEAYTAWIEALQSKKCQGLAGKELEEVAFINAWIYNCLLDARTAAVTHLTWAASTLKGDDKINCIEAAKLYQEEIDILKGAKDFVKYPQNIKSGPKWSAEMRAYQIEALKKACEKDKAAVAALEKIFPDKADNKTVLPE